jgi:hypothetical protein
MSSPPKKKSIAKFRITRPEEREGGPTVWFPIGSATLIETADGKMRLLMRINHIPGEIIGFLDEKTEGPEYPDTKGEPV